MAKLSIVVREGRDPRARSLRSRDLSVGTRGRRDKDLRPEQALPTPAVDALHAVPPSQVSREAAVAQARQIQEAIVTSVGPGEFPAIINILYRPVKEEGMSLGDTLAYLQNPPRHIHGVEPRLRLRLAGGKRARARFDFFVKTATGRQLSAELGEISQLAFELAFPPSITLGIAGLNISTPEVMDRLYRQVFERFRTHVIA